MSVSQYPLKHSQGSYSTWQATICWSSSHKASQPVKRIHLKEPQWQTKSLWKELWLYIDSYLHYWSRDLPITYWHITGYMGFIIWGDWLCIFFWLFYTTSLGRIAWRGALKMHLQAWLGGCLSGGAQWCHLHCFHGLYTPHSSSTVRRRWCSKGWKMLRIWCNYGTSWRKWRILSIFLGKYH